MATGVAEPYDIDHRIRRADGVYRWFHGRVIAPDGYARECRSLVHREYRHRRPEASRSTARRREAAARDGRASPIDVGDTRSTLSAGRKHSDRMLLQRRIGRSKLHTSRTRSGPKPPGRFDQPDDRPSRKRRYRPLRDGRVPERTSHCFRPRVGDALAAAWRPMAMAHGLRACWATPISSATGKVLGAFAVYYGEPRTPTPQELGLIDQFTHIASIAIDRAQSDAALKRSEARKAAILDAALDCIITIDHEGCVTEFNPAAERTFGYRRDDIVGKQLADAIIPPSLREKTSTGIGPIPGHRRVATRSAGAWR